MNFNENQGYQHQNFNPGQNPTQYTANPGVYSPDAIQAGIGQQLLGANQPNTNAAAGINPGYGQGRYGPQGLVSLLGLTLQTLEDINTAAGRALEGAQGADTRQTLWQIQQLANQSKSFVFQMRGMVLQ